MTTVNKTSQPNSAGKLAEYVAIPGMLLQNSGQFFEEIRESIDLRGKISALLLLTSFFLFIYGAILGSGHPLQALSSAIKLPLIFLGGLFACTPALYIFDILLGSRRSLSQTMAILLAALNVLGILLFSFAPIAIVLRLTVGGFQFFKLLNVGFLLVALLVGLIYLERGLKRTSAVENNRLLPEVIYAIWLAVLIFMIGQLAWSLRPFFYYPGTTFTFIVGSNNLFTDFVSALGEFLGFWVVR